MAITEYHTLGRLNNRNVFLTVLEAGKSKVKMSADLVSGENPLSRSQMAVFSLCPHILERGESSLLHMGTNPLISSPRPTPNAITLGIKFQHMSFGGQKHSVYSTI